jgi:hypothetical protein
MMPQQSHSNAMASVLMSGLALGTYKVPRTSPFKEILARTVQGNPCTGGTRKSLHGPFKEILAQAGMPLAGTGGSPYDLSRKKAVGVGRLRRKASVALPCFCCSFLGAMPQTPERQNP